jgi:RNA polymerase sigma factor for flagellar operon FliA
VAEKKKTKARAGAKAKARPKAAAKTARKAATGTARKSATKAAARSRRSVKKSTPEAEALQRANAELWARYVKKRAPEVREQLILQYAPLVKYVMGRLAISLPAILDYEDILSFGTIGLIEAVERFEPDKGVKFETYAISRVRGSIIDALRALDRLPRSVRQKAKDADAAILSLTNKLGREPSEDEIADTMGITPQAYRKLLVDSSWVTVSLDAASHADPEEDGGGDIGVSDPEDEEVTAGLERRELIGELGEAIQELPDREQLVLSLYYKEELTMREVSKVLGISESRVCQLHARALTRLRTGISRIQEGRAA